MTTLVRPSSKHPGFSRAHILESGTSTGLESGVREMTKMPPDVGARLLSYAMRHSGATLAPPAHHDMRRSPRYDSVSARRDSRGRAAGRNARRIVVPARQVE